MKGNNRYIKDSVSFLVCLKLCEDVVSSWDGVTKKGLQILVHILIANTISRISRDIFLQVKNGGRGGWKPAPP